MLGLYGFFSELKRLLAISPTRLDHDTTPSIISSAEPTSRDPHLYRNGIFPPPPPQRHTPAYPLYPTWHIPPPNTFGHPSSGSHLSLTSLTRSYAPTSQSPPTSTPQLQAYSPLGSDGSLNVPPPAYIREDLPPTYPYSENLAGRASQTGGAGSRSLVQLLYPRRSGIVPVMGPMLGDPSQNQYPGAYRLEHGAPRRGRDMYRGTLFARVIPARRNLWLPAIVIGAVVGVYVLVKVGGKDKDDGQ